MIGGINFQVWRQNLGAVAKKQKTRREKKMSGLGIGGKIRFLIESEGLDDSTENQMNYSSDLLHRTVEMFKHIEETFDILKEDGGKEITEKTDQSKPEKVEEEMKNILWLSAMYTLGKLFLKQLLFENSLFKNPKKKQNKEKRKEEKTCSLNQTKILKNQNPIHRHTIPNKLFLILYNISIIS